MKQRPELEAIAFGSSSFELKEHEKSKKQHDQEEERNKLKKFHEWWVKNSNNSKEV